MLSRISRVSAMPWCPSCRGTIFAVGVLALAYFVTGLKTGWSQRMGHDLPERTPGRHPAG